MYFTYILVFAFYYEGYLFFQKVREFPTQAKCEEYMKKQTAKKMECWGIRHDGKYIERKDVDPKNNT